MPQATHQYQHPPSARHTRTCPRCANDGARLWRSNSIGTTRTVLFDAVLQVPEVARSLWKASVEGAGGPLLYSRVLLPSTVPGLVVRRSGTIYYIIVLYSTHIVLLGCILSSRLKTEDRPRHKARGIVRKGIRRRTLIRA